jgi:excisionase family DNA binding protein
MAETPKLLLTPDEVAEALGLCRKSVYNVTAPRGDLRSIKIGSSTRYAVSEIQRWISQRQSEAS